MLRDRIPQRHIAATEQARRAILHHGHKFRRSLPRVQRNDDQALGHDGQIHRNPFNAVMCQQRAAIAFVQALAGKKSSSL